MCKKIVFVSGSRSDFGLIQSIIRGSMKDDRFKPYLIRVGHSNLDDIDFLTGDFKKIKTFKIITEKGIKPLGNEMDTTLSIAQIITKTTPIINQIKPDILFVPGDRFEILSVAISAYYQRIPIAHIFGGDKSEGGHLDDSIRHAITKISHLHFPVCEDSYKRIKNLGEEEWRIFNYGSPVVDNLKNSLFKRIVNCDYAVLTYHPITSSPLKSSIELDIILKVLKKTALKIYITSPNNELGSNEILNKIIFYTKKYKNLIYVGNLGWEKYLNYVKYSKFSIGNSSSNLLESPILGVPSIDIGDRQKGRFKPKSVLSVKCNKKDIKNAIENILKGNIKKDTKVYGKGNVSYNILNVIYKNLKRDDLLIKKVTY